MGKVAAAFYKYCLVGFGLLVAVSCNTRRNIPFPAAATEFEPPVTRPFHWPVPVTINWIATRADTIAPPVQHAFDIDKIKTKPFFFDGFTTFATAPATEKIDWANLPSEKFSTDTIPATKLVYKTIKITPPIRIKSGIPKTKNPVSKNIVHFGQDEGLPVGAVQAIYQDKKGVFWIATGRGLCRYDGEYFELFSFISKEPQGSIQVRQIAEDSAGHIWIRTDSRGIYVYDYAAETVVSIEKGAYDFCMGNNGLVWTLNYNGDISLIDPVKLTAQKMNASQLSASAKVARVLQGNEQQILFRTAEGIRVLDRKKKKIFYWNSKSIPADNLLFYFLQTTDGHLLTKTESSVEVIDPAAGTLQHFTNAQGFGNIPFLSNPAEDNNGDIWQARADSGMEVLDMKRNALLKIGKADGLSEAFITCTYNDRDGKMWIGTNSGGINIIDNTISINHLSVNQGLSDNSVWSMLEDNKGQVWFGSSAGIDVLNMEAHTIKSLSTALELPAGYSSLPRVTNGKNGEIWSFSYKGKLLKINTETKTVQEYDTKNLPFRQTIRLMVDHSGMIWINTFNDGVLLFNPQNNTFRHINAGNGLAGNLAWRLLEDKDNRVWAATSRGLSVIDADRTTVTSWRRGDGLSDDITQALVQDSLGRIWVSTNEGVDLIDNDKKTITAFARKQGLAENESYALECIAGKIYAGTSSGISIIENTGEENNPWRISSFARAQGLYYLDVNSNTSLLTSKGKIIWGIQQVATIMDVPRRDSTVKPAYITAVTINGKQKHFYNTQESALPDTVWSEVKDTFYTKENVTKIFTGDNNIAWKKAGGLFNLPAELQLHYNQNQLSFQFTGLHTADKDKVRYCYILEGLDEQWSKPTEIAQSPDYNNLSPGDYAFKVCSKAANGVWSKPAELHFSILPPWWKRGWAYALYAIVFAALVRAYVVYRSRLLTKENVLLEEKVNLRTAELKQSIDNLKSTQAQLIQSEKMASLGELTAGIAHEIQNPLNFVNNFSEINKELLAEMNGEIDKGNYEEVKLISKDITGNEEKINHHGKRADAIVKGMLQHSRSSSAIKEPTDINKLADEYLRLAYHGLRAKDKSFNAALHTDFDEKIGLINIVPQDIGRVILNLITNAFYAISPPAPGRGEKVPLKPGYEPAVWVSTKKQGNKVDISVRDNGGGVPPAIVDKIFQPFFTTKPTGQGTGLGLSLSYDIVKAHGGDLKVESKEGEGTEFTITLPVA